MSVFGVSLSNLSFRACQASAAVSYATMSCWRLLDTPWIRRNIAFVFSSSHSPADFTSVSDDCPSLLRTCNRYGLLI